MFQANTRPAKEISRSNANSQQSALSAWQLSLSIAVSLVLTACGGATDDRFGESSTAVSAAAGDVAGQEAKVASDSLVSATVYGVNDRPTIAAFSVLDVQSGNSSNVFDFSISGQQRSNGGYQSWTDKPWARVSYLGKLGQYRLTIDSSQWSSGDADRTFTLVANNNAGQTLLTVKARVAQALAVPTSTPLNAASVSGVNGRPSITSAGNFTVRRNSTDNLLDFTIDGPQRRAGGHQAWTDQLWAKVSYLGQLGKYRVAVDTRAWDDAEMSRSFKIVANNDAGHTTLTLNAIVGGAASVPVPSPTPAPTPVVPPSTIEPTPQGDKQLPVTVSGTSGRPTLTSISRFTVASGQSSATLNYSISGPQHSSGGYQSWTDQSWATVAYAGQLGKYRLTVDLSNWSAGESSRTLRLIANNVAGQTSLNMTVDRRTALAAITPTSGTTPALVDEDSWKLAVNSVDSIIDDMSLPNDAQLLGIPEFQWAVNQVPAQVAMGADPRGCFAPAWWHNIGSVPDRFKDCDYWTGYVQWFIVFEGAGNNANNVRIETRRAKTWYLSKRTGQWKLMDASEGTDWFRATKVNVTWVPGQIDLKRTESGSSSLKVDKASPYSYHGVWDPDKISIAAYASDIAALFSTVQARLIVDDPNRPDDRNNAMWLLHNGGDYYPDVNVDPFLSIPPGVGLGRAKKITSEWQSFNFATLSTARQDYRGPNPLLTPEQFRLNPPPLD